MDLPVPLERVEPDKSLSAVAALVRLLLRVGPIVAPKLRHGRELFPAVIAHVRFNARVYPHVKTQIPRVPEPPRAYEARVRPLRLIRLPTDARPQSVRCCAVGFSVLTVDGLHVRLQPLHAHITLTADPASTPTLCRRRLLRPAFDPGTEVGLLSAALGAGSVGGQFRFHGVGQDVFGEVGKFCVFCVGAATTNNMPQHMTTDTKWLPGMEHLTDHQRQLELEL